MNLLLIDHCSPEYQFHAKSLSNNVDRHGFKYAIKAKELVDNEIWDDCYKFAFVRNPWDRMVSMYEHLNQYYREYLRTNEHANLDKITYVRIILKRLHIDIDDFSFEVFIKKVLRDKVFENYHWDTQLTAITDTNHNILMDKIGRFENLLNDFKAICMEAGLPNLLLPHHNKTNHSHYNTYYTTELKSIVSDLYLEDIDTFKYRF